MNFPFDSESQSLYSLFSTFSTDNENSIEWQEVLHTRRREAGGVSFTKQVPPRIKLNTRPNFFEIMFNSRFDWKQRRQHPPDIHFYFNNPRLFELMGNVYDQMEYSEEAIQIHRSHGRDRNGYPRGIVDVEQVIPLSMTEHGSIDMYYTTIDVYSCDFGTEEHFCCVLKDAQISNAFRSIFIQSGWII